MEFYHKTSRAVPNAAVETLGVQLTPYLAMMRRVVEAGGYSAPECSLVVPQDDYMVGAVETLLDKVYTKSLRYVFVIGIGGSNLGTKAIYDAMAQARDMAPHGHPRLLFIETVDATELLVAQSLIKKAEHANELLFVVISKSGSTTETTFNAEVLLATFAERFGRNARRVVVMSETGSPLLLAAREQQMHTLELPPNVGGRYSVFTPVGLFPLALMGFSPRSIKTAAMTMLETCLHPDITLNPAALSALTQYYFYQQGVRVHDTFLFAPALESTGKWYRQLLAESLGKTVVGDDRRAIGITPTVSIGSTDLHSVGQLYLGGPKDRLTTFVSVLDNTHDVVVPVDRAWPDIVSMINGRSASLVMGAILAGTKSAYDTNGLPYLDVRLSSCEPEEIAAFMQFKMCEVMMLGYLLHVNPFDQPHVEQYKTVTKQLLSNS
jgi:glucose-6-phosphate isomerase